MSTAVTKAAKRSENLPAVSEGFEEFAGAGMEKVNSSDLLVPRLTIVQELSPQRKKGKPEFNPDAEVGDIVEVGTGTLFKSGVLFLPVHYEKQWLEWAPRSTGKGLLGVHENDEITRTCRLNEKRQPVTSEGNFIIETAQWFGINLSSGRTRCFLPMASTQLKHSRKWMLLATGERLKRGDGSEFAAPLFYRSYSLTTAHESNNEGDWASWKIERSAALPEMEEMLGVPWQTVKEEAVKFRESLLAGTVKGDVSSMEGDQSSSSSDGVM